MIWQAPEMEITLGETTSRNGVMKVDVVAARNQPVATAFVELSNVRFEWQNGAKDGDALVLKWGWRGQELAPLFTGTVVRAHLRETLQLWGLCRGRALVDTRVTRTYQNETALAIIDHLIAPCRYKLSFCTNLERTIDKLPLQDNTLVEAITFLNRRLSLAHDTYCDPLGGFHWEEPNRGQDPAASFTQGVDVEQWLVLPGDRFLLTTMGTPLWHSKVLSVTDRRGVETPYFVEQVRHTLGIFAAGSRSRFWLKPLARLDGGGDG